MYTESVRLVRLYFEHISQFRNPSVEELVTKSELPSLALDEAFSTDLVTWAELAGECASY